MEVWGSSKRYLAGEYHMSDNSNPLAPLLLALGYLAKVWQEFSFATFQLILTIWVPYQRQNPTREMTDPITTNPPNRYP